MKKKIFFNGVLGERYFNICEDKRLLSGIQKEKCLKMGVQAIHCKNTRLSHSSPLPAPAAKMQQAIHRSKIETGHQAPEKQCSIPLKIKKIKTMKYHF